MLLWLSAGMQWAKSASAMTSSGSQRLLLKLSLWNYQTEVRKAKGLP